MPDYLRANLRLNLDLLTKFPFGIVLDVASLPIWNVFGVNQKGGENSGMSVTNNHVDKLSYVI